MQETIKELAAHCAAFRAPNSLRAISQILTTTAPFLILCAAMYLTIDVSYWITLALAVPTGGLVIRFFIIQHDCGHGSFFTSKTANDLTGRILSVLTITPYAYWRRAHALHHASSANLDRRGIGDISTLTVAEYTALPPLKRLGYRIYRNPLFLLLVGGPAYFLVLQRLPLTLRVPAKEMWTSVLTLDAAMVVVYGAAVYFIGWTDFLLMFAPVIAISSIAGVWMFYVQHQFEETHWEKSENWDRKTAAVLGSSYYVLPRVLQWFTGNIGLHHIHHLCSQIPNYRLQECLDSHPILPTINRLTFWQSLKTARLALWCEERKKLVAFSARHYVPVPVRVAA
ncbi:fatty acid desaturase [Breoghania sp. L-A4]|uniref:fatty acid desaturase n=1 Tax=Breoghania sp. L-A4 TaxID=2304600 RepID=UPI000E35F700|nr:fatty acid desaturase [Breoghania sp. L-A4]AXS42755.1 fatty acid desaturase [Breoghania sp. L-A4]